MSNLHRELAPISSAAWEGIEEEAKRSFKRNVAGRRLVDVDGPHGLELSSVSLGHTAPISSPREGISALIRKSQPIVELKVPFTLSRTAIDDVERGAQDPDWDPVIAAARTIALAEDHAIFNGWAEAQIAGIRESASAPALKLPDDVREYPDVFSQAASTLRLASVDGPYALAVSADIYTQINETTNHGYPIIEHVQHVLSGDIVWAPAIDGAFLLSTRGGDFQLTIGQELSIGYDSHDASSVNLYFTESLSFAVWTPEAAVAIV
jgi:uncharacterized linocin/CFP29 family protein